MNQSHDGFRPLKGLLKKWFGKEGADDETMLRAGLAQAAKEGILDSAGLQMMEGVLEVSQMRVRKIMVTRPNMVVVDQDATHQEIIQLISEKQHSRYPVMEGEEVIGILFAKDLLPLLYKGTSWSLKEVMRDVRLIPESQHLNTLLGDFRRLRQHMAVVVDEYNHVVGLVTIEDVLEQIVGDIHDEHDDLGGLWIVNHGDQYTARGETPLSVLRDTIQIDFESESETLAGLLLEVFEHFPEQQEKTTIGSYRFRIMKADEKRIYLVNIKKIKEDERSTVR